MEFSEIAALLVSTSGLSVGGAHYLAKKLIEHKLEADLAKTKSDLQIKLNEHKADWEGKVKQEVETVLADRAADRQYVLDARKRLYLAVGPLRFQLLMACRDLAGRVQARGLREDYSTDVSEYYGRSTLYRILRPLVLADLVERQVAYADFSVDASAVNILRFRKAAYAALSGGSLVEGHPQVDWVNERQHVFNDSVTRASNAVIVAEQGGLQRCMRSYEFDELVGTDAGRAKLSPFPALLKSFAPDRMPLFWARLVAYGNLCTTFVNDNGGEIGFEKRDFPVSELLARANDRAINDALGVYTERCMVLPRSAL